VAIYIPGLFDLHKILSSGQFCRIFSFPDAPILHHRRITSADPKKHGENLSGKSGRPGAHPGPLF
jgi:hypothetical protein